MKRTAIYHALIFFGLMLICSFTAGIVAALIVPLLTGEAMASLAPGAPIPTGNTAWLQLHLTNLMSQAIGFGGAVWLAYKILRVPSPIALIRSKTPASIIGWAVVLALCSGPLLMASYELNGLLIPEGSYAESLLKPLEDFAERLISFLIVHPTPHGKVLVLFTVAVAPALFEELAFRGVLQPFLLRATGSAVWGILLCSIVFSAFHFQFYGFLPRMLLGVMFGWLAYRTGSLWPAIAAHFVWNARGAVTFWVTGDMQEELLETTWLSVLIGLVLCVLTAWWIHRKAPAGSFTELETR